ncbi:uncharacterized protein LOC108165401 [Drosophila miranda]|uniref:uncharacterized protein LOC108165401 n=1 Tax=Drosophila miranda TaxID=7229 RepID=UPI0007E870BC|nr:uncharacterized protein LOC108165401 [Drosophila miranda]
MSSVGVKVTPLRHFITRSSYEGAWNKEAHMMDGLGTYHYPDGSEYRGRFLRGKFHGFGQLRLAQPYRFTIKGVFNNGKLVSIEDMCFPDGLHVQGQFTARFTGIDFDSSDWDYLTPKDRRYQSEHLYSQPPVGPTAYVTSSLRSRLVPKDCYDVEEGIYNPQTGWLTDRPLPFTSSIYVGCPRDKEWIQRHCRHAHTDEIREPIPYFCRHIIDNNLQTEMSQLPKTIIYAPNFRMERKHYYHKLCKEKGKSKPKTDPSSMAFTCNYNPNSKARATEQCLRAHEWVAEKRELEDIRDLPTYHFDETETENMTIRVKPRQLTSSSDDQRVDSVGPSSCRSDSFALAPIPLDLTETYDTVKVMMNKKTNTDYLNVVQSNMLRRSSYMEISRSRFQL